MEEFEELEPTVALIDSVPGDEMHQPSAKPGDGLPRSQGEMKTPQTAWQKTELARHAQRPQTLDYIERLFTGWSEIHGDRTFGDDPAIICGMARFHDAEVLVIGTQKGRDMKQRVHRNFGTPHPEGYRKALRAMKIAEKFHRPIFTLVDTDGAYPGIHAEERGQAEAIARNLKEMAKLRVPVVSVVLGEGGSGGALALGVANRVLMLEFAIYSVITPEGCASILWKDAAMAPAAAEALRLTAPNLLEQGLIDAVVDEPLGGAHSNWDKAAALLKAAVLHAFDGLAGLGPEELVRQRYEKFSRMGSFSS